VALSSAGKRLLPYAERIVKIQKEALRATRHAAQSTVTLSVGVDRGLYTASMRHLLSSYTEQMPDVELKIEVTDSKTIHRGLMDHVLDIGFVYGKSRHTALTFIPHKKDRFLFIKNAEATTDIDNDKVITKSALLDKALVYTDYGKKFDLWIDQLLPKDHTYSLNLMKGINPAHFVVNSSRYAFILESELEASGVKNNLQTLRIKGADYPYLQSYFVYERQEDIPESVTGFIKILNSSIHNQD
jgi:LysR family transcriptional repressor of citA